MMTIKILINNVETDRIDIVNQGIDIKGGRPLQYLYTVNHYNYLKEEFVKDFVAHDREKGRFNLAEIVSKKISKKVK